MVEFQSVRFKDSRSGRECRDYTVRSLLGKLEAEFEVVDIGDGLLDGADGGVAGGFAYGLKNLLGPLEELGRIEKEVAALVGGLDGTDHR